MPTALVTGANRGIGLHLTLGLVQRGYEVIATHRSKEGQLASIQGLRTHRLDVADAASVQALRASLEGQRIDLLVNNAGLLQRQTLDDLDLDGVRAQLEVNALGPLRVTAALQDLLGSGSTVAIVSSRMGSIADNTSGSHYGYRMSKAAVNMAGKSLSVDLRPRGIGVVVLHPGYVRTDMTGGRGNWGPAEAAAGLLDRIHETTLENTGRFVHADGTALDW
jgi:NAD(P)-dependent dehydrogenase (short-subunit alcohol dehydrogenase family)